jgi:hypothetical protein
MGAPPLHDRKGMTKMPRLVHKASGEDVDPGTKITSFREQEWEFVMVSRLEPPRTPMISVKDEFDRTHEFYATVFPDYEVLPTEETPKETKSTATAWAESLTNAALSDRLHMVAENVRHFSIPDRNALLREAAERLTR